MSVHPVKMITFFQDFHDGSSGTTMYNSLEELARDRNLTEAEIQAIVDDDDPYENGSLDETTIEVIVDDDGSVRIKPFSVYSGNQ